MSAALCDLHRPTAKYRICMSVSFYMNYPVLLKFQIEIQQINGKDSFCYTNYHLNFVLFLLDHGAGVDIAPKIKISVAVSSRTQYN